MRDTASLVTSGPINVAGLQRIADPHLRVRAQQALVERGQDRALRDDAPRRRAALAGGANGAEQDRARGQIQVRVLGDDDGVVAAQFEDGPAEAAGDGFRDAPPTAVDPVNETSGRRRSPSIASPTVVWPVPTASVNMPVTPWSAITRFAMCCTAIAHERRRLGGLPHHRVAADGGERRVPRPDRDGKVEGRDDADRAERMPLLHHAVPRPLGGDRQAVELAREADREVADVDHLLHLAVSFRADLAHLERDEVAERLLHLAQCLAEVAHELAALRRGRLAPAEERRVLRPRPHGRRLRRRRASRWRWAHRWLD